MKLFNPKVINKAGVGLAVAMILFTLGVLWWEANQTHLRWEIVKVPVEQWSAPDQAAYRFLQSEMRTMSGAELVRAEARLDGMVVSHQQRREWYEKRGWREPDVPVLFVLMVSAAIGYAGAWALAIVWWILARLFIKAHRWLASD